MGYSLGISTYETQDPGNNTSTVHVTGTIYTGGNSYSGYSTSWSVVIDGVTVNSGSGPTALWNPDSWSFSGSRTFTHNANGERGTVSTAVYFSGSGGYSPGNLGTGGTTYAAINYDRKPDYCTAVSASRSGTSYTVTAGYANSPAGTPTYYVQYSENGGAWYNQNAMPSQQYTYTGLNKGSTYNFRVWATNSDGIGPNLESGSIYYVPTEPLAPASLTVGTPVGRSVTVTAGTAPNGGSSVTGYYVQYSTDNGSTWSTAQAMSSQIYTYSNLNGGLTYLFRAYATNEMGNGTPITSSGTFVPAGGKRWTGSTFTATTTGMRWDGNSWVNLTTTKRWNGTDWVNLT